MEKKVTKYTNGVVVSEDWRECKPLKLSPASECIQKEWYDVIQEVFSYEKERGAEMQEIHKLFMDDRVLAGRDLFKTNRIKHLVKTDVDIRADVLSEDGNESYMVVLKKWLPDSKGLLRRYEMVRYVSSLFFDCSCKDHMMHHYRSNSALACKHVCAVMWFLQNEDKMPKFFETWDERTAKYQKSAPSEILSKLYGRPMKKFTPYLNVVLLPEAKWMNPVLALSIHMEYNKDCGTGEWGKPTWIAFNNPQDIEQLIDGLLEGYKQWLGRQGLSIQPVIEGIVSKYGQEKKEVNKEPKKDFLQKIYDKYVRWVDE